MVSGNMLTFKIFLNHLIYLLILLYIKVEIFNFWLEAKKETIREHGKLLNRRIRELEGEYGQKCRIVACT